MATPTRRNVGSASTPSHPNQSSPVPRSVPSPVAARQPAGKTPVNHPTTGSTGSKTLGSTPMVQNLSQTGYTSSPSANMPSFSTPSGLGIEGTTPAGLSFPTPGLGGAPMMPTMSELGLTASGVKRNEDEERRSKMRKVLKSIGKPKGTVSEEGIARISRRVGFFNDIDAEKLTQEEKERKVGNRPISTAGNTIVIDFDLKDNMPQTVQVAFTGKAVGLKEQGELAGQVLLNDLRAPDGFALNAKLDRFAMNLERLARIDRLSSHGINCFEALSGIYTSLSRLYEQEKLAVRALFKDHASNVEEKVDNEVMCKKSGRPLIHGRGGLGLELMYWREDRRVFAATEPTETKMEVDGAAENNKQSSARAEDDDIFTLLIEAEACPAGLYPSLRISDTWIDDSSDLLNMESGEGIPWQDPPPTLLGTNPNAGAMAVDGEQKLPDLRFVAKLDPPLVMPYQTAMNVLSAVGAPTPQMLAVPPQYAALLLGHSAGTVGQATAASFTKETNQIVLSQEDGEEVTVMHRYALSCAKPNYADYGFKLSELPFSHPRQLIELLPTLRQWASVGSLLKSTFGSNGQPLADHIPTNGAEKAGQPSFANLTLDDLLASPEISNNKFPVNITLATSPTPTLGVTFPTLLVGQVGNVNVQILPNADVLVTNHEGVVPAGSVNAAEQAERLAKALDVCGDLGVWIEWVRTRNTSA